MRRVSKIFRGGYLNQGFLVNFDGADVRYPVSAMPVKTW
jgi:hypothetical protein